MESREHDEERRLASLHRYDLLDTLPEQALDELTELVGQICQVPIALISLVDQHRQWFKSRVGLQESETPRELSFCSHALHQKDLLTVTDATKDERFAHNPLVTGDPKIRFYSGAPLVTPTGEVLGTLCVIDTRPRVLSELQAHSLRTLGRQVMTHFELRRQTRHLQESESRFRAIVQSSVDAIVSVDTHDCITEFSPAAEKMFGRQRSEVVGLQMPDLLIPSSLRARHGQAFSRHLQTGEGSILDRRVELTALRADGSEFPIELTVTRSDRLSFTAVVRDITEAQRTQVALLESEARLAAVVKGSPVALAIHRRKDRKLMDVNPAFTSITGWSADQVIGRTLVEIGMISPLQAANMRDQLQSQGRLSSVDAQISTPTGEVRHVLVGTELMELSGEAYSISTFVDITDRKRSEARFRRLVDSNAQGVFFWNREGKIAEANDAFLQMVGYDRQLLESGELHWSELTPREYAHLDARALEEIRLNQSCAPYEKEYIRADGSRVPVLLGAASFEDNPEEGVCFVLDLSERKRLEQQFLQAQRMESIGTLSGGIAHDLNNSLGPIFMALSLLESRCQDPESQEMISVISSSAQRAASMVRQILSFARGVEGQKQEVSLPSVMAELEKIVREAFPKSIRFELSWPTHLRPVIGDATQIHQVLLNLCLNARDAMPDGGCLSLSATDVHLDKHYLALYPELLPGEYVSLTVADTGQGIPEDVIDRIFEPFFTTKPFGQGTGLGLSTAQAIVRSHGGFLKVYSQPGQGTQFTLCLPSSALDGAPEQSEPSLEILAGQSQLILLVEDEPALRLLTQQTLERYGYRVITAADGAEALAIFTLRRSEIALVLTDIMMPVMDGPTVIPVLQRLQPGLPIIASSGLSSAAQEAQLARLKVRYFLPKPYTASSLLGTLQEALQTRS